MQGIEKSNSLNVIFIKLENGISFFFSTSFYSCMYLIHLHFFPSLFRIDLMDLKILIETGKITKVDLVRLQANTGLVCIPFIHYT